MMGSTLENKVDMKRRMKELQSQVVTPPPAVIIEYGSIRYWMER